MNKVIVIVTGGSRGIGRDYWKVSGTRCSCTHIRPKPSPWRSESTGCLDSGGRLKAEDANRIVSQTHQMFGSPTVLIKNAAVQM